MSHLDFEQCTWREFLLRFDGYQIRRGHEMEGFRAVWHMILNANWDHEKKPLPPMEKFWPLITDEGEMPTEQQAEQAEYQRLMDIMSAANKIKLN